MTIRNLYPDAKPSLLLDFAKVKALDPRIAFTRSSTALVADITGVYREVASNVPRFDHNPLTGESLGLLIEEQRTNQLIYSADISNAAWGKFNVSVTADNTTAPDGTLAGDKLLDNSTNGFHRISQLPSVVSGTTYTFSVFLKAAERTRVTLQLGGSNFTFTLVNFNLSTGTVASGTGTITDVGNGWYRCSASSVAIGTGLSDIFIELTDASGNRQYVGDGSGVFVWGAQIEAGAFPTSYIPTVASQVTRAADSAIMSGTNFSSWYRPDEGTIFVDCKLPLGPTGTLFTHAISTGAFSSSIYGIITQTSYKGSHVVVNSVGQADDIGTFTGLTAASGIKDAFAYQANNFGESCNGLTARTDTTGSVPTAVDRLFFGAGWAGGVSFSGTLRKFAYYPSRLSNTELQALTR